MNALRKLSQARRTRLLVSILAPPTLGALLLILTGLVIEFNRGGLSANSLKMVFAIFIYAQFFMGIKSLVSTMTMEFVVRRLARRWIHLIGFGALLGLVSAVVPVWIMGLIPVLLIVGVVVGLAMGWFLSLGFKPASATDGSTL